VEDCVVPWKACCFNPPAPRKIKNTSSPGTSVFLEDRGDYLLGLARLEAGGRRVSLEEAEKEQNGLEISENSTTCEIRPPGR
jgi:hypothetical protein